jgi:hypothetical protein
VQAQQAYDAWDTTAWSFENSTEWYYKDQPDGSSQLMVHVDYIAYNGYLVAADYSEADYEGLDRYVQDHLTVLGNQLSAADDAYAMCGY